VRPAASIRLNEKETHMRRILMTGLATAAALVAAAAASAAPAPSPSYQVAGLELGAPQANTSPFAGTAIGSTGDRGFWQASVAHDPLTGCATVGASCAVTGGTFTLRSSNGSQVAGTFSSGSVQLTSAQPGCGRQQFAVTASLSTSNGPETLTAVLTHFRFQIRGVCTVLAAVVQGSLAPDNSGGGGGTF
jgi:hypothetical protein